MTSRVVTKSLSLSGMHLNDNDSGCDRKIRTAANNRGISRDCARRSHAVYESWNQDFMTYSHNWQAKKTSKCLIIVPQINLFSANHIFGCSNKRIIVSIMKSLLQKISKRNFGLQTCIRSSLFFISPRDDTLCLLLWLFLKRFLSPFARTPSLDVNSVTRRYITAKRN